MANTPAISKQTILIHDDQAIADWVRQRIPHVRETGFGPCTAFGVLQDGALVGGVVFSSYRRFDIHMSAVLNAALTRQSLRTLCEYVFGQLNVRRVTAITGKKNRKARRALRIIGFTEEGTCKHALDGEGDAVIHGLLREHCKWI